MGNGRTVVLAILLFTMFAALIVRLLHIQVWEPEAFGTGHVDLLTQANEQQTQVFLADSGRGTIYDRRGAALTGERDYHIIVFPLARPIDRLTELSAILGWTEEALQGALREIDQPQFLKDTKTGRPIAVSEAQARAIQDLNIPGVHALYSEGDRYAPNRLAHHLLGTIRFNTEAKQGIESGEGVSTGAVGSRGLEKSFDPFLRVSGVNRVTYAVDGAGKPLSGDQTEWENTLALGSESPKSLVTSVDAQIQQIVEQALDQSSSAAPLSRRGVSDGAAVVLDIASGDVLAMASRPHEGEKGEDGLPGEANRALLAMEPGSIFKTVIAVAALDQGIVRREDEFFCDGKLHAYNLPCWTLGEGGHGHLTFADAYAESCNVVFGELAVQLGGDTIAEYADKLGIGHKIGWEGQVYHDQQFAQLPEEEAGQLFHDKRDRHDRYALAQTGIGQRDVRVTPLQAANMVVSLFHPGKLHHPRVVSEIQYDNGDPYFTFEPQVQQTDNPIKSDTLQTVRQLMIEVVQSGTASPLSDAEWKLGGKTGTAQVAKTGKEHKWMIGFGPLDKPQYAVAVVSRYSEGGEAHLDTFQAIMDGLARYESEADSQ